MLVDLALIIIPAIIAWIWSILLGKLVVFYFS